MVRTVWDLTTEHTMQARMLRVEDMVCGYFCGGVDALRDENAEHGDL